MQTRLCSLCKPRDAIQIVGMAEPHRVGDEALLPVAEDGTGRIVHVSQVPSGLRCGCVCPSCGGPLIAYKGAKKAHYFGHAAADGCNPQKAFETALHKLAKQLIAERRALLLPEVVARFEGLTTMVSGAVELAIDAVAEEVMLEGMRPDLIAMVGGKRLAIEVAVTHFCEPEKIDEFCRRRLPAVEIDLSKVARDAPPAELEAAILTGAPRVWLFNPKLAEAHAQLQRIVEANQERKRQADEAKASRLVQVYRRALALEDAKPDPRGSAALTAMDDMGILSAVGCEVHGDLCFGGDRRHWQARLLAWLIENGSEGPGAQRLLTASGIGECLRPSFQILHRAAVADWPSLEPFLPDDVRLATDVLEEYLKLTTRTGLVARGTWGGWMIPHAIRERLRSAQDEARTRRQRLMELQSAVKHATEGSDGHRFSLERWMKVKHPGLEATPESVAVWASPALVDG